MNIDNPSKNAVQGQAESSAQRLVCPRHRNKECIYLSTDPARTDDIVFKCEFCVVEQTLQSKYLLPISQLAASDLKTVFWHWPLPDNSELLEKVRALSIREKPDAVYKKEIDKFFKELRNEIMAKIDEVQAVMNKQAEALWDFDHSILEQYSQLSAKEALKDIVLDSSEGLEQLSMRIRKTVTGVLADTEVAAASLTSSLEQLALQESAVDFTGPQKIKEDILGSISKISIFVVENMQDLQVQPAPQIREMEAEAECNIDIILRLASCRFNDLSQEFRERMSSQLHKFRKIFDRIQFEDAREECKRVVEFDSLGEEEVREVKSFAERLIEAKKRRERGDYEKNVLNVEDLMRLLKNKANHASEEMIRKSQALLKGVSKYIASFEVDSIYKEGFEQEEFEGMSDSEIWIAGKAIQEVKELFREGLQAKEALEQMVNVGKQMTKRIAQPQHQNSRSLNAKKIIELVKNDTNYCSEEYVGSLQTALKGVKHYLESFQFVQRENEGLNREQLSILGRLGSKIKDLTARYGQTYKERLSPNQEEQPKSVLVSKWLKNNIGENGVKELDSLLCKLPVFELTERQWKYTCINWKWIKTGFCQSSTLEFQNEQNGVRVIQKNNCPSQAVTENNLDNSLVYSMNCTFNKPLNGVQHVMIGLIPEDQINGGYFGNDSSHAFWSCPGYGPTQIIKGQLLNSSTLNTTLTTLLFKFCIQTQTFLQADQTLQNINKIDKSKINPKTKYRFGICYYYSDASNYSCVFSDVMTSLDQASADQF